MDFFVKLASILLFAPLMRLMNLAVNCDDSQPKAMSEQTEAEYRRILSSLVRCGEPKIWRSELQRFWAIVIRVSMS